VSLVQDLPLFLCRKYVASKKPFCERGGERERERGEGEREVTQSQKKFESDFT
jgi:hypothetical protein